MGYYLEKEELMQALAEDKETIAADFVKQKEKDIVNGCYDSMKTEILRLARYMPDVKKAKESKEKPAKQPLKITTDADHGYKGFLAIQCKDCGMINAYCAKRDSAYYRCRCGGVTEMKNMVNAYAYCECGRRSVYQTNTEEAVFDINCISCGCPVTVQWNSKSKSYQTVRR